MGVLNLNSMIYLSLNSKNDSEQGCQRNQEVQPPSPRNFKKIKKLFLWSIKIIVIYSFLIVIFILLAYLFTGKVYIKY